MQNFIHSVGEFVTPILKESRFLETGRLTPEEFVAAGDYLVYKCPTWQWAVGDASKRRSYLPKDKQFLITKSVPCPRRVKQMQTVRESEEGVGSEWTDAVSEEAPSAPIPMDAEYSTSTTHENILIPTTPSELPSSMDDIPDLETFEEEDNMITFADPGEFRGTETPSEDNIMRTRTYDLSITYDKYYQTPRLWLCGYDEDGSVLQPAQVFEDISQEHAHKTVTIEPHPHLSDLSLASIHPCKHAHVMRSIIATMQQHNRAHHSTHPVRVDQYLVLFLKFMGCVLPTIEYDHTMSVNTAGRSL